MYISYAHIILRLVCSNRVENVQYLPIPSTYTSDMVISATLYNYVAVNLFRTSKWERLPCFEFPFDNRIIFNKSFSNSLISTFISHQQTKSSKKITQHQPNPQNKTPFFSYQQKLQAPWLQWFFVLISGCLAFQIRSLCKGQGLTTETKACRGRCNFCTGQKYQFFPFFGGMKNQMVI